MSRPAVAPVGEVHAESAVLPVPCVLELVRGFVRVVGHARNAVDGPDREERPAENAVVATGRDADAVVEPAEELVEREEQVRVGLVAFDRVGEVEDELPSGKPLAEGKAHRVAGHVGKQGILRRLAWGRVLRLQRDFVGLADKICGA